jgi:serine/threonine-protein kinase
VIATLVDAATEQPVVPSVRLDRQLDELLSVQDDVARDIADRIAAAFAALHDRPPTQDAEAYHAFKRGQHHWRTRFAGGWREAIEQFQYAVQRDSRFALAHTALASAYEFLGFYTYMKPSLAFAVARRSAERALELDDKLAQAHTELALIRFGGDWDWEGSEDAFRRALELDPNDPIAHVCYAWLLVLLDREDAAVAEAKAGWALAPTSRFAVCGVAQTLYLARRYDETIELCNECLRHDPDYVFAVSLRGQCYELKGMFREAVADLEHSATLTHRAPFYVGMLGHCYGEAGMRTEAVELIAELNRQSRETYVAPQCYVYVYAGLGERSKALGYQERAYEDGASPFNYLAPSIRELYALDPQQRKRLEQMRLII